MSAWRLGVLAAVLGTGTACFQVDAAYEVGADGSLSVRRSMWLTPGSVALLHSIMEEQGKRAAGFDAAFGSLLATVIPSFDDAARAEAAAAGVTVRESRSEVSASALGFAQDVTFPSSAVLGTWWPRFEVGGTGVPLDVTCTADRLCTVFVRQESAGPAAGSPELKAKLDELGEMFRGPSGGKKESKKAAKQREERMAQVLPTMMMEMGSMAVTFSVTVPGEVVEPVPTTGVQVDGGKVTWTLDVASLMAEGGAGAAGAAGFPLPSGDALVFRAAPGVVLPGLE